MRNFIYRLFNWLRQFNTYSAGQSSTSIESRRDIPKSSAESLLHSGTNSGQASSGIRRQRWDADGDSKSGRGAEAVMSGSGSAVTWEDEVRVVIAKGESVLPHIKTALTALATDPNVEGFIKALPVLKPFADRLIGLIPVVGQVQSALALIDFILAHGDALLALGAALHFAPADQAFFDHQEESRGQQE